MKLILVDDDPLSVAIFCEESKGIPDLEILSTFGNARDAHDYVKENPVDVAVLDIEMNGMNGLVLGALLKQECPDIELIYITAYEEYAEQALKMQAAYYITKPYSSGELKFCLRSAGQKVMRKNRKIYANTFGNFDLYVNGKPVMFRSAKAKELLAYLIDKQGSTVNSDQIIGTLWENRPNDEATQSLCSKLVSTLRKELSEHGADDILVSSRGVRRIDTTLFDCDLYQLLSGDIRAAKRYMGEYMSEYSWAEGRMASLERYI